MPSMEGGGVRIKNGMSHETLPSSLLGLTQTESLLIFLQNLLEDQNFSA